jgi:hypothetical protein
MAARLDEFRGLKQGWLNGKGHFLNPAGLDWLTRQLETVYPEELSPPYLYPTAEGGVQAEWTIGKEEISLEINLLNHTAEWHQLNLINSAEDFRCLNLNNEEDWKWIFKQIQFCGEGA